MKEIFYYKIWVNGYMLYATGGICLLFTGIQGRDKESSPDSGSGSDHGHTQVGEVLDLGELGHVNLCLAEGMVVDIEVVGIEGVCDSVGDMEGRHGVEAGDEDGRDTVANDMEDRGSNQEPDLVGILPLDTPDRLVVVEGDD